MKHRFRRPAPATVIASVALLVALSGTGVAAVAVALPANSVGNAQLQANSVTSGKVADHTLKGVDFAPGVLLKGPKGPTGPGGTNGTNGAPGATGPTGPAGSGATFDTKFATGTDFATSTNVGSFTDLPGATTQVTVPTGATANIVATFTGESACYGGVGYCSARILVDGTEALPASGADFAFDSTDNNTETAASWESHSVTRIATNIGPGNHTVSVQDAQIGPATWRIDDWTLVATAIKQ